MDETLRNLRAVISRKMDFHAPYAKALLGNMLGIGPSSPQNTPQENLDVLTVQVEAVGSGKVIIPALELASTTTVNEIKKKIFDRQESETIKHFQSYGLFIGHGGPELTDPYQQMKKVRGDYRVVTVAQNEEKDHFMKIVALDGRVLQRAPEYLKNDKDIVMAAVTQNGYALEYASEMLENDKDIVMAAVEQYGYLLQYAPETLKNDKDIVMAAVTQCGKALQYASETLRNDKDIVIAAVTQNGYVLFHVPETLENYKDIVIAAAKQNVAVLGDVSYSLRNNKDLMMELMEITMGTAYEYASYQLRQDTDIRALMDYIQR